MDVTRAMETPKKPTYFFGQVVEENVERKGHESLWNWFGLSYASWLTLPRSMMHEMPDDWQMRMADLLNQWDATWSGDDMPSPHVCAKTNGKFCQWPDWLLNYRHPNRSAINALRVIKP